MWLSPVEGFSISMFICRGCLVFDLLLFCFFPFPLLNPQAVTPTPSGGPLSLWSSSTGSKVMMLLQRDSIRLLSTCPAVCKVQSKLERPTLGSSASNFQRVAAFASPSARKCSYTYTALTCALCLIFFSSFWQESSAQSLSEHIQGSQDSTLKARKLPAESELHWQGQRPPPRQSQPWTTLP